MTLNAILERVYFYMHVLYLHIYIELDAHSSGIRCDIRVNICIKRREFVTRTGLLWRITFYDTCLMYRVCAWITNFTVRPEIRSACSGVVYKIKIKFKLEHSRFKSSAG